MKIFIKLYAMIDLFFLGVGLYFWRSCCVPAPGTSECGSYSSPVTRKRFLLCSMRSSVRPHFNARLSLGAKQINTNHLPRQ